MAALLFQILEPLQPFYTEGCAGVCIGHTGTHYENRSIPMEAFARPLWGLTPFWAGSQKTERESSFAQRYRKGLAAGSDPSHPEYWGGCRDLDQKFVEMAAIAYGMLMAPDVVWEPLSGAEKERLAAWLGEINRYECSQSNWQFFCILTNVALRACGMPYSKERLELGLSRIESYYEGGGWYRDGKGGHKDYYIGFAIHFYSILYTMFCKKEDPERCRRWEERAVAFGRDFIYWFAEDGSAVAYGRSQTYRFAQCAFYSVCAAAGLPVFPLPVLKGIITRHLAWWMEQPIFDNAGILTIGYGYPNLLMQESYNAPGSPYWCLKAFACLALPKEHEFWQAEAAPLPPLDGIRRLSRADALVQRIGGQVFFYPPGRTQAHQFAQAEEKYSKFVYASRYGFSVARSQKTLEECAPDSMLSFAVFGHIFVRGQIGEWQMGDDWIRTAWSPVEGIDVKTEIRLTENGHIRKHEITSRYDVTAYDAGFAVPADDKTGFTEWAEGEQAYASDQKGFCRVTGRKGEGSGLVLHADPNTNMMVSKTVIPMVAYQLKAGVHQIETEVNIKD